MATPALVLEEPQLAGVAEAVVTEMDVVVGVQQVKQVQQVETVVATLGVAEEVVFDHLATAFRHLVFSCVFVFSSFFLHLLLSQRCQEYWTRRLSEAVYTRSVSAHLSFVFVLLLEPGELLILVLVILVVSPPEVCALQTVTTFRVLWRSHGVLVETKKEVSLSIQFLLLSLLMETFFPATVSFLTTVFFR